MAIDVIDLEEAMRCFEALPASSRAPGLRPDFVLNDAINYENVVPVFLRYVEGENTWLYNFLMGSVALTSYKDIFSAWGYGGPAASSSDKLFIENANKAFISWAKQNNVIAEFIRFHPVLHNWRYYNGDLVFNRNTVIVCLEGEDLLAACKPRVRSYIRKAEKQGVRVDWYQTNEGIEIFKPLYLGTMTRQGASEFYFFDDAYFSGLMALDKAQMAIAYINDRPVYAGIFLMAGDIVEYHIGGGEIGHDVSHANRLMFYRAFQRAKKSGYRFMHLGGGSTSAKDDALLHYKQGFSTNEGKYYLGMRKINVEAYVQQEAERKNDRFLHWRT